MSGVQKVQQLRLVFEITTLASEPLALDDHTLEQLRRALNDEAAAIIDLRYYPESRYQEERHQWVGVHLSRDQA